MARAPADHRLLRARRAEARRVDRSLGAPGGDLKNIQVTHGSSLDDARSESVIRIDPANPKRIVGASRKCKDIAAYDFTVATVYSSNGGKTWHDSAAPPTPGWTGLSDPTLAWDDAGNVFLVGAAITNPPRIDYVAIAAYKSTDGGRSWSAPTVVHASSTDEKAWAAGDSGSVSYHGRLYIAWADNGALRFARSLDHGSTWIGTGADPAGSVIGSSAFSPAAAVAVGGDLYVANAPYAGNAITIHVSMDGGDSFTSVAPAATGITTLEASLPPWKPNGWPVLPGATFRVFTIPTICLIGTTVIVAWADYREGASRIYYARSTDGGTTWSTAAPGQPLLTGGIPAGFHHFHPQLAAGPDGVIGCAFYEYGPKRKKSRIDVILAQSKDDGASFKSRRVTKKPWDPTVDAPTSLVDPVATFIGEYFGLDADGRGFHPLWTDTRTGIQELFTARVRARRRK
jgi:hypothetical protein